VRLGWDVGLGPIDFYWFSGTGNTLLVVRRMTEVFREAGVEVRLHRIESTAPADVDPGRTIGLGFPVAAQGTYPFVWDFVGSLPISSGTPVFMVDTMLEYSGGIVGPMRRIVESRGYRPVGAREVRMPGNCMPGAPDEEKDELKRARGLASAKRYARDLLAGRESWGRIPVLSDAMASFSKTDWCWRASRRLVPLRVDESKCTECGLCARLCPVDNVEMDGLPRFLDRCCYCMRCIAFCPTRAISARGYDYRGYRAVKAAELLRDEQAG